MAAKNSAPTNGHSGANGHTEASLANEQLGPRMAERRMTVGDIASLLGAELIGDADTLVTGVAAIESARPGAILFIENEGLLKVALASSAAAIIAPQAAEMEARRGQSKSGKPTLLTGNPRLAFAKVMEYFQPFVSPDPGIHPTAIIESDAHIGDGVSIREFCYVGHHVHIGNGTVVYPHVVIGDGAQIGDNCILQPSVVINPHVFIGQRVRIHSGSVLGGDGFGYVIDDGKHRKVPQMGTVIIEDDVEIGANVCIDRATMGATRIGSGTKIDNLVQIAHNCQVGRNCILCGQVGLSGSVIVEDNVVMAGQTGIADHMKIGKGAVLAGKSGIMTDIGAAQVVVGSPAIAHREFMKREAATRKLPDALQTLHTLEKRVRDLEAQLKTETTAADDSGLEQPVNSG
jgi:UDP-3-O-[3-hydroxymyristoyl] glucosamine N-acyltransferase